MTRGTSGASYAAAGVDIDAGERAVDALQPVRGEGAAARGARRHRRLRGPLRAEAGPLHRAGAGRVDRRGRHQGRDRPGAGQARHDRARPGRDGRRRPRGVRGRAAVPAGLHRGRQARARAHRGRRGGHRGGLPAGGLRAAGRGDRRAPRDDGGGRLRPVGHRRRHRRGRRDAAARARAPRRRADRHGQLRPALQRLLAGPPRAAADRPDAAATATSRSSGTPSARSCSSPPRSTPATASRWSPRRTSARSRTSPAAGWRATWRGCCPTASARSSSAAAGPRSRCSG